MSLSNWIRERLVERENGEEKRREEKSNNRKKAWAQCMTGCNDVLHISVLFVHVCVCVCASVCLWWWWCWWWKLDDHEYQTTYPDQMATAGLVYAHKIKLIWVRVTSELCCCRKLILWNKKKEIVESETVSNLWAVTSIRRRTVRFYQNGMILQNGMGVLFFWSIIRAGSFWVPPYQIPLFLMGKKVCLHWTEQSGLEVDKFICFTLTFC